MHPLLQNDLQQLADLMQKAARQSVDYIQSLPHRSTTSKSPAPARKGLPEEGKGAAAALEIFNDSYESLMVASSGPRYLGFVTGGGTPAAVMGDWLSAAYDQNTQAVKGNGDVSALLELETIDMLLELFRLPKQYVGGFVTGATQSNFTCLATARQWAGHQQGRDIARQGLLPGMKILSATPHSSSLKCLALLGWGSENFIQLPVLEGGREAMDVNALKEQLTSLKGGPAILISSGGTVNTVDYDDMQAIARLKEEYNFWWHIDAAFGAFAVCTDEYAHLLKGWEKADSITVDCHKWLNVPYDSAIFLVKEEHRRLQMQSFQNSNAPYLGDPFTQFSYMNLLPENSRRLRALPAWFSLKAYGRQGYASIVENSIRQAQQLGEWIDASSDFELLAPVRLNTVCFALKNATADQQTHFLHQLTARGKVFMTPTVFQGRAGFRAAFVNWMTGDEDTRLICEELRHVKDSL